MAGYVSQNVSVDRLVSELWRAAQSVEQSNWRTLLKARGVTFFLDATVIATTPEEAVSAATRSVVRSRQSSLATDVAKRALVQGFLTSDDPRRGFAEALFCEVTTYLVSRDLSGYVGNRFRNRRVSEAIGFKNQIRGRVQKEVAGLIEDQGLPEVGDETGWNLFVDAAVTRLSG